MSQRDAHLMFENSKTTYKKRRGLLRSEQQGLLKELTAGVVLMYVVGPVDGELLVVLLPRRQLQELTHLRRAWI